MEKCNQYFFSYINGELDDQIKSKLEQNDEFMRKVVIIGRRKDLYEKCSVKLKRDPSFVKEIIDTFKDDYDFLNEAVRNFKKQLKLYSKDVVEINILLSELYYESNDERLSEYAFATEEYYANLLHAIDVELSKHDEDEKDEIGTGFIFAESSFSDSIIAKRFFARRMTEDILLNTHTYDFDEFVHYFYDDKDKLIEYGEKNFLYDYIYSCDPTLKDYLTVHPELLDEYVDMVKAVEDTWDEYVQVLNEYKIDLVYDMMDKYIIDNKLSYDYMSLLPVAASMSKNKDKIFKYLQDNDDETQLEYDRYDINHFKFVNYMKNVFDTLFERDVEPEELDFSLGDIQEEGKVLKLGFNKNNKNDDNQ